MGPSVPEREDWDQILDFDEKIEKESCFKRLAMKRLFGSLGLSGKIGPKSQMLRKGSRRVAFQGPGNETVIWEANGGGRTPTPIPATVN